MGDRVIVLMKDQRGYSPGVYMHWGGAHVLAFLEKAASRMRKGDASYAAARFCGVVHGEISGNLSLGLLPAPATNGIQEIDWKTYSHGDAGVVVVDVDTGNIVAHAGYLAEELKGQRHLALGGDV